MNSVLVTIAPAMDAFTSMYCPARSAVSAVVAVHVAELHRMPAGDAQAFEASLEFGVGVELGDRLAAGARQIGRAHDDERHAVVDAGHFQPVDDVAHPAGRQQPGRYRAGGVEEADADRRAAAAATAIIDATRAVDAVIDSIADGLRSGDRVAIAGFGTFVKRRRLPRRESSGQADAP